MSSLTFTEQTQQIPIVNLSELDPSLPGGDQWEAARAAVAAALRLHGCFDAIYAPLSPELRDSLFCHAVSELLALPLEVKLRNSSDEPFQGYIGQIPNMPYESLRVDSAPSPSAVEEFTQLMWPQGNPTFRNAVIAFTRPLQDLMKIVHRMILESFGVESLYESFQSSISHGLRLSEYGVPFDKETKIAMVSHIDPNLMTIVCQHEVEGLEVKTADGDWIKVVPSPNSVTVMIGQAFQVHIVGKFDVLDRAWTNGRLRAPVHRVKMTGDEGRFSALYGSRPNYNSIVQTPEEFINEENPRLYRPYNYTEYMKFRYSDEGKGHKDPFISFCGIGQETTA
ncbi:2'-deoxymugineic-acid 2'-dioxygenase [Apostasia shenzhenica]|uniref:2-oxoglutarate-dependent dioxygenase DAO n=1 Tax=Apostasia shenzhenica TaxID=1088818 RepID=A0A2I0B5M0_9ASPA|nr:2'-deoxymugineic-acid 2'-dioxygenase [Apostasia shenzhenica]